MRIIASDLLWSLLFASAKTHLEVPHEFLEGLRRRLSRQSQHVYSRRHIAAATRNGRAVAGLVRGFHRLLIPVGRENRMG